MAKTYPDIGTFTSGQILTAATMNDVGTNLDNFRSPPLCIAVSNATKTLTKNTFVTIDFQTEDYDTDGMHSNVTNNSRITPTTAGVYLFSAYIPTAANAVSGIATRLYKNGTTAIAAQDTGGSSFVKDTTTSGIAYMNGTTDYMEIQVYYGSTSDGTASIGCRFNAVWMGTTS